MPQFIISLVCLLFVSCASQPSTHQSAAEIVSSNPSDISLCYLLYDLTKQEFVVRKNSERCKEALTPCSTFKIPLAVMAFDSGTLKNEKSEFKWDGKKRMLDAWNQDHTAASWMNQSVVWFSQRLTKQLGRKKVQNYLNQFNYGNKDFSGPLDSAWLTAADFSKEAQPSLKISGYEQIEFLKKLWSLDLKASSPSQELTKHIMFLENSPNGFKISGKTGSGFINYATHRRLAWFVAVIEKNNQTYLSVLNYYDLVDRPKAEFGSGLAKELTFKFLIENGLY